MKKKLPIRRYKLDEQGMMGVYAVSLVDEPAIMVDWVALAAQNKVKLSSVNEERQMLYGPLLIPDQLIYRRDDKTGEEWYNTYDKELIRQTAHRYLKMNLHHNATVMHELQVAGCTVVESWLKEYDNDKSVGLGFELPVGTWFVGMHVQDAALWDEVKKGTFKGFSIEAFFQQSGEEQMSKMHSELIADLNKISEELSKL